jgi:hypothetical protein
MSQYAGPTPERWMRFSRAQQVLQIAVEMHRARYSISAGDMTGVRLVYERVVQLANLTIRVQESASLRSELERWRDVVAGLSLRDDPDAEMHDLALRVLLQFDPGASPQVQYLCA